jgi:Flp pilus assembly protein TadD
MGLIKTMTSKTMMRMRLGLALLAATALGAAVEAQTTSVREDAGTALTRHLRTISDQPRNVSALIGAGKAALELGDPQAALTFFARAEEIAPRDGRIKAGMGAAFVQMEQAQVALKFFADASSLGVPEAEFAGDRGLAHDLNGDPRRAQADYALALRRQEDPEVRRRLALSLGISGDRAKAIATIDGQLRNQDRAAWRVRSFILALTGDAAEATRSAEAVMPAQAAQMRPFFAALPALKPAERAMAVHFGHFPSDGRSLQVASSGTQYASVAPGTVANSGQQATFERRSKPVEQVSAAPRRRPGTEERSAEEQRQRRTSSRLTDRAGDGRAAAKRVEQPKPTALADAGTSVRSPNVTASPQPGPQQPATQAPAASMQQPAGQAATQPGATAQIAIVAPPLQTPSSEAPSAAGSTPAPLASVQTQPVATGWDLGVSRAAPVQGQPSAAPGIQLAEIAPSQASGPAVGSPTATSPEPNASQQTPTSSAPSQAPPAPARATGLAGIAAAIDSLPGDGTPTTTTKAEPAPAARVTSNNPTKPAYGPKFEAVRPEATKLASVAVKSEPAAKDASTRPAAANKDDAKATAARKGELKVAAAKKEEPKAAAAKKGEEAKVTASKKVDETKAAATKKEAATKLALAKKAELANKEEATKAKQSSRHWVQIAGGANEAAMSREFVRLKAKAPKLLAARTAWTTPLRATNRLLVGPFKTSAEAQEFVNELAKLDLPAFSWTSPSDQEIVKLAAGSKSPNAN